MDLRLALCDADNAHEFKLLLQKHCKFKRIFQDSGPNRYDRKVSLESNCLARYVLHYPQSKL